MPRFFVVLLALMGTALVQRSARGEPAPAEEIPRAEASAVPSAAAAPAGNQTTEPFDAMTREKSGEFRSGGGFYFLKPVFSSNPAFSVFALAADNFTGSLRQESFSYGTSFSPRVWGGYTTAGGVGARVCYWNFNQAERVQSPTNDAAILATAMPLGIGFLSAGNDAIPGVLSANSGLNLYAIDMDVTKDLEVGKMQLLYGGGFRYGYVGQHYQAYEALSNGSLQSVISGRRMVGFGPSAVIEDRYPLGESGLNLFGTMRGSLLFGSRSQSAFGQTLEQGNLTGAAGGDAFFPVAELEIGGEYHFQLLGLDCRGRLAFVGQSWWNVGNSSGSSGTSQLADLPFPLPNPSVADEGDLGLYGFTFTLAVDF